MKKNMTLVTLAAFAAFAASVQAATITWGFGADVYLLKAGEDYTSAVLATDAGAPAVKDGSYLALVYVGQDVSTFDIADISDASIASVTDAGDAAKAPFKIDPTYSADFDPYQLASITVDGAYDSKASFAVVWFDAGRGKYDYIYSIDDGSAIKETLVMEDMSGRGSGGIMPAGNTTGYGGVLTVPEPSTALLGLLGLGMLLKRRRA